MPFPTLSCCTTVWLIIKMSIDVKTKDVPQNIHSPVSVWLFWRLGQD